MQRVAFLLDVDNTLLNNDDVSRDLRQYLDNNFGEEPRERYWTIFEQLRSELGYADYLGALQRYRLERLADPDILRMSPFLIQYPFRDRLYEGALDAISRMRGRGPVIILSDGDAVFQPWKVERSGLGSAVDGNVLIYVHKEQMLDDVERLFPAQRYVMVDDKVRILTAMKKIWGARLTTIWVKQGHYAADAKDVAKYPAPDVAIDSIGELRTLDERTLTGGE